MKRLFLLFLILYSLQICAQDSVVFNLGTYSATIYKDGYAKKLPQVNSGTNGKYLTNNGTLISWASLAGGGDMLKSDNLSGLANYTTARSNLGLVIGTNVLAPNGSAASLSSFPTFNQNTSGSAATLTTPRLINGVSFNGSADISTDTDLLAYAALGSAVLTETVNQKLAFSNTATPLVDGQIKFTAVYLPKAATLTGIKVYVRTQGNYTADNNNRIGLYSYSGGVLTLVASSANSGTLWTSAANGVQTIPFSGTYAAIAGIYYVGLLYNQSAVVTAPGLASGIALNNSVMGSTAYGFTNSAKLHGTANGTDLTTPINMSAITSSVIPSWVALY